MKKHYHNNYLFNLFFSLLVYTGLTQANTTQWSVVNRTNFDLTKYYPGSQPEDNELPYSTDRGVKIHIINFRALYNNKLTGIISNVDLDLDTFDYKSNTANATYDPSVLDINISNSWNGSIIANNNTYWLQPVTCRVNSENATTTINIYRKPNGDFWAMIISKSIDGKSNFCHAPLLYQARPCQPGSKVSRYGDICPL
ncbi:MAG: hypothetical protein K0R14_586 [Burkholderiales bacterium]|jgi:hypothetical protein|nr:hypothetical protein [Burkholderiales bacterium]